MHAPHTVIVVNLMNDAGLYHRLRRWTNEEGVRLERDQYVYALVWTDQGTVRLIEVSFAQNAVAARTGIVETAATRHGVRLEGDKRMTSWHCAPYHRLEELLRELHTAQPDRTSYQRR